MSDCRRQRLGRVRRLVCVLTAALAAGAGRGAAETVIETWSVGRQGSHPGAIRILKVDANGAVILADLSALPAGARIRGARLLVEREAMDGCDPGVTVACEVYPLTAPYRPGARPQLGASALAIPPAWYDHFDATEVVRRWAAGGKGNHGLYVKALPGWREDRTRLEIAYEAKCGDVPKQAGGLKVLHRAGQTFITWEEIEDPFGGRPVRWGELRRRLAEMDRQRIVRYRIYRHGKPIDAGNLAEAQLLAVVEPLSGFNVNSWSKERLINQTVFGDDDQGELGDYDPFRSWDRDSLPGGRLVIPRFVIDEKAGPLPPGTGLYVHSVRKGEPAYYAVVTSVNGRANTRDFSPGSSLAQPVRESPGEWQPVLQAGAGGEFAFDFPGSKQYYVTWVAPPLANLPQRQFNWCVHLPPKLTGKAPLNVSFHDRGFSCAKPIRRFVRSAVQIAGHDFAPVSGWYGYHECLGTLRSWKEGKVQPYTEARLLAFIEWAKRKWPIDERRCFADGRGMGGTGAVHFACKHPELLAYVLCDRGAVACRDSEDLPALESAWGRVGWARSGAREQIKGGVSLHMETPWVLHKAIHEGSGTCKAFSQGTVQDYWVRRLRNVLPWLRRTYHVEPDRMYAMSSDWAWHHPDLFAAVHENLTTDPKRSPTAIASKRFWGEVPRAAQTQWGISAWRYYDIAWYARKHVGFEMPMIHYTPNMHEGDFGRIDKPRFYRAMLDTKRPFLAAWGMQVAADWIYDIRRTDPLAAFGNCSLDSNPGIGMDDGDREGQINGYLRFDGASAVDRAERWEMTVWLFGGDERGRYGAAADSCTVDITPRRCRQFRPRAGQALRWTNSVLPEGPDAASGKVVQTGTAAADRDGLVTCRGVVVTKGRHRIVLQRGPD